MGSVIRPDTDGELVRCFRHIALEPWIARRLDRGLHGSVKRCRDTLRVVDDDGPNPLDP
jgi:hypothetical protein